MKVIRSLSSYFLSMRTKIRSIANTPYMKVALFSPPIAIIAMTLILIWFYRSLPPKVPLYYSRPWGEEQLASPISLFILPGGTFLWYAGTLLLIHHQTYQYRVFAQLLLLLQSLSTILILLVVYNILHLVL